MVFTIKKDDDTLTVAFPNILAEDKLGTMWRLEVLERLLDDPRIVGDVESDGQVARVIVKIMESASSYRGDLESYSQIAKILKSAPPDRGPGILGRIKNWLWKPRRLILWDHDFD